MWLKHLLLGVGTLRCIGTFDGRILLKAAACEYTGDPQPHRAQHQRAARAGTASQRSSLEHSHVAQDHCLDGVGEIRDRREVVVTVTPARPVGLLASTAQPLTHSTLSLRGQRCATGEQADSLRESFTPMTPGRSYFVFPVGPSKLSRNRPTRLLRPQFRVIVQQPIAALAAVSPDLHDAHTPQ